MSAERRAALAAVGFLTRLPVGDGGSVIDGDDVRRAGAYFPLVGAALGACTGALASRLAPRCSPPLAGALAVAAQTLATGALHLDALADSADALGAGDREQALEVMRDPRIGAFGASAVALDLLVKAAALGALAGGRKSGRAAGTTAAAGALSRAVPVGLAAALPYARPDGGTGLALSEADGTRAVAAGALALAAAVTGARSRGLALAALAALVGVACGVLSKRSLGGVTGDTLGAALELTETALLVAAVALGAGS